MKNKIFAMFFFFFVCVFSPAVVLSQERAANEFPFAVKTLRVKKNDSYYKLFKKNWRVVMNLNRIGEKNLEPGARIIFPATPADWEKAKKWTPVPEAKPEFKEKGKVILVDLKNQYFGAYESGKLKFWGPISSGAKECVKTITTKTGADEEKKDIQSNCETPAGFFRSLARHKDHFSSEYEDAEGNGVPMPYAVMFTIQKDPDKNIKTAFWIHGGVLPGYPASHGCVRVREEDAENIFYFVNPKKEEGGGIEWFSPKKSIPILIVNE